jgi:hypothetical protein
MDMMRTCIFVLGEAVLEDMCSPASLTQDVGGAFTSETFRIKQEVRESQMLKGIKPLSPLIRSEVHNDPDFAVTNLRPRDFCQFRNGRDRKFLLAVVFFQPLTRAHGHLTIGL